jgi:hypothetical protein
MVKGQSLMSGQIEGACHHAAQSSVSIRWQDIKSEVLPSVTPPITAILTLASMIPALITAWRTPDRSASRIGSHFLS